MTRCLSALATGYCEYVSVGLMTATFFTLGPVYSQCFVLDVESISYFMTAAVIGITIFQLPSGAFVLTSD